MWGVESGKSDVAIVCNTVIKVVGIIGGGLASMRVWNPELYKYTLDTVRDVICGRPKVITKVKTIEKIVYVDADGNTIREEIKK